MVSGANGGLRRLRLVASLTAIVVTSAYVLTTPRPDPLVLVGLIGWGLATLGLWQWRE